MTPRKPLTTAIFSALVLFAIGVSAFITLRLFPTNCALASGTKTPPLETLADLYQRPGIVVIRGYNDDPVGALKLKTYRVEELVFSQTITVGIDGNRVVYGSNDQIQINKLWRVVISGGPFHLRASPPVIWIDTTQLGVAQESENLSEISVIVYDYSLLKDGATLSVTYGNYYDTPERVELPEKLGQMDLYRMSGTVIAQGQNTKPTGFLKLKTYRVEEILLPQPKTVEINGNQIQVNKAWRITINGDEFRVGALAWYIWINTTPLNAVESWDLSEINTIIYDVSLLKEGATLSVTYGKNYAIPGRVELSEKLHLSVCR